MESFFPSCVVEKDWNALMDRQDSHICLPDVEEIVPEIPNQPYQPQNYAFPQSEFEGTHNVVLSFKPEWFNTWNWLHYNPKKDAVFCYVCLIAHRDGVLQSSYPSKLYTTGFRNWRISISTFNNHKVGRWHVLAENYYKHLQSVSMFS